jgi:LuxR family maltose regulon positive regulatory protein
MIEAPPGYGKTVLLSQLYQLHMQRGVECFWAGLEDREIGFTGFLAQIENALGLSHHERALAENALRMSDTTDRIESILDFLSSGVQPRALFIDNISFCSEPGIDKLVSALAFQTPKPVRLFISSSVGAVPFDATRAKLELNLQMIGPSDLSFDSDDISVLFARAGIDNIDPLVLRSVVAKTEGWPAAVRLLQLGSKDEKSLEQSIDALTGEDSHIADILSRRLMSSFEPDLVAFLLEISLLRYFSAELARAMTGDERAFSWIKLLADRNVMIVPANNKRGAYRFHTLFREFLDSEAVRVLPPERRRDVGVKAAQWLMKRAETQSALDLALRVNDLDLATKLLEDVGDALVRVQGDTSAYIAWVKLAKEAGAEVGVQATIWHVWALLFERRFAAAFAEFERATEQLNNYPDSLFSLEMRKKLQVAAIEIAIHRDVPDLVQNLAADWTSRYADAEPFETAAVAGSLACSRFCSHDFMLARRDLTLSQAAIACTDSEYGRSWVQLLSGMIELSQGNSAAIEPVLRRVEERAREKIGPKASIASIVSLVRARALYDCGRFDEALAVVGENLVGACATGIPDTTWLGIDIALPSAVRGDGPFTIDDLRSIVREYPKRLGSLFEMGLIRSLIFEHRNAEALDRAAKLGWENGSGWKPLFLADATEMERSSARLAAISLFTVSGHLAQAAKLIQEEMPLAQRNGRRLVQIDLHLLIAELQMRSDARPAALRAFSRAISLAAGYSLYSPFLRRASLVRHILELARRKELGLTSHSELQALAQISDQLGARMSSQSDEETHAGMANRMTPREVELLFLLEAGLDNTQLAERLSVSLPTVKWHLSNLYCKLDVKNRSAAVAKGRALRLL